MKIYSCIVFSLFFAGCASNGKKTTADLLLKTSTNIDRPLKTKGNFIPYKLNDNYTVIDTGQFENQIMGGSYAIVDRDSKVDTIDRRYGIQKLGSDSYMYLTLTEIEEPDMTSKKGSLILDFGNYTIVTKSKKVKLKDITNIDDQFSSAAVIKGKIYFWQLVKADTTNGMMRISAAQFDPITNKTISHFLFKDGVETDDTGYFSQPYSENNEIVFSMNGKKKWKYTSSFK